MNLRLIFCMVVLAVAGCSATADTVGGGIGGLGPVNFQELERRDSPNDYLVCPDGFCRKAKPDRVPPVFPISAKDLKARVEALLSTAPRTEFILAGDTKFVAEQRSLVFRFPDTIDIEVIAVGPATSTLAIYSRSRYGRYDLGANARRVDGWLAVLAAPPNRE